MNENRLTVDESKFDSMPYVTSLSSVTPDTWKNIPVCVVKAIKSILTEVIRLDKKSIEMVRNADETRRKI